MKKVIVLGMSLMLLWSCNNSEKPKTSEAINETQTATHKEPHHNESPDAIELVNGEKWTVNEEMKPFVMKGEELVNDYIQNNQSDYKVLAVQLKDQNTQLIRSCTMTGKSHDELHKWLHPHLEIVKTLESETDEAKANQIVLSLQKSYQDYHHYFN